MTTKTHFSVYKHSRVLMRVFMWTGVVLFILGLALFFYARLFPETERLNVFSWNYLALAFQGLIAWVVGYKTLSNEKYFVEWNNEEIRWWLPRRKEVETMKINDVRSVEIQNMQVVLGLENEQKIFNLKFFFYPERKMIMEKFETIRQSLP